MTNQNSCKAEFNITKLKNSHDHNFRDLQNTCTKIYTQVLKNLTVLNMSAFHNNKFTENKHSRISHFNHISANYWAGYVIPFAMNRPSAVASIRWFQNSLMISGSINLMPDSRSVYLILATGARYIEVESELEYITQ